jgi:hypothetical protein
MTIKDYIANSIEAYNGKPNKTQPKITIEGIPSPLTDIVMLRDVWNSFACAGYLILALRRVGCDEALIMDVLRAYNDLDLTMSIDAADQFFRDYLVSKAAVEGEKK